MKTDDLRSLEAAVGHAWERLERARSRMKREGGTDPVMYVVPDEQELIRRVDAWQRAKRSFCKRCRGSGAVFARIGERNGVDGECPECHGTGILPDVSGEAKPPKKPKGKR